MSKDSEKVIKVGSRKSELALIQTKHVIARLQKLYPDRKFEIHTMSTIGDRVLNISLPKIGEKSLFTRDLEDALRNGGVDLVVHSLKDLPTALPIGMVIGAILEREDSRDALVLNERYKGMTIDTLPPGCVIGTSSLRRTAQLRRMYPHLEVCDIRGNLNTRLAKLDAPNSKFAGIILAQAGLIRMGWTSRISQILEPGHVLYAVGQGALAVECRASDNQILDMLQRLMCPKTTCRTLVERSFLKTLGGGCSAPVAVSTKFLEPKENNNKNDVRLEVTGAVWSLDGQIEIREKIEATMDFDVEEKLAEDAEGVSPSKKIKLNEESAGDDNSNKKEGSPKVVNDDFLSAQGAGDASKLPDIQYLIEVHGELFKRCPFYILHQRDKDNGNSAGKDECPLKIPIGQDFMGQCPYVETKEKVELSHIDGSCPVLEKVNLTDDANSANIVNRNVQLDFTAASASRCPFSGAIKPTTKMNTSKLGTKRLSHEDCPFIQKNIKLIDYDESKPTSFCSEVPCLTDVSKDLFCGLYRHKCYNLNLYTKCENLGKRLAENLIANGALDVMKCAQQEVRDKA